jgi:hypothetical protein
LVFLDLGECLGETGLALTGALIMEKCFWITETANTLTEEVIGTGIEGKSIPPFEKIDCASIGGEER